MASEIGSTTLTTPDDDSILGILDAARKKALLEVGVGRHLEEGGRSLQTNAQERYRDAYAAAGQALIDMIAAGCPPEAVLQEWSSIVDSIEFPWGEEPDTEEILRRFGQLQPGTFVVDVPSAVSTDAVGNPRMAGIVADMPTVAIAPVASSVQGELPPTLFANVPLYTSAAQSDTKPGIEIVALTREQLCATTIGGAAITKLAINFSNTPRGTKILEQLDVLDELWERVRSRLPDHL